MPMPEHAPTMSTLFPVRSWWRLSTRGRVCHFVKRNPMGEGLTIFCRDDSCEYVIALRSEVAAGRKPEECSTSGDGTVAPGDYNAVQSHGRRTGELICLHICGIRRGRGIRNPFTLGACKVNRTVSSESMRNLQREGGQLGIEIAVKTSTYCYIRTVSSNTVGIMCWALDSVDICTR